MPRAEYGPGFCFMALHFTIVEDYLLDTAELIALALWVRLACFATTKQIARNTSGPRGFWIASNLIPQNCSELRETRPPRDWCYRQNERHRKERVQTLQSRLDE
jgi:hypothetical protein